MVRAALILGVLAPILTQAQSVKLGLVDSLCFDYAIYKNAMTSSTNSPGGLSFKIREMGSYNIVRKTILTLAENRNEALTLANDLKIPNFRSNAYDVLWAQKVSLYEKEKPLLEFTGIEFGSKPKIETGYKIQVNPVVPIRAQNFDRINASLKSAVQNRKYSKSELQDFLNSAVTKCKPTPTYKNCVRDYFEDSLVVDLAIKSQLSEIISEAKSFYLSYSNSVNVIATESIQKFSEWIKRDILRGKIGGVIPPSLKTTFRTPLNILKTEFAGGLIYFFANAFSTSGENASSLSYMNSGFMAHPEARRSFDADIEHLQFLFNESNTLLTNDEVCKNLKSEFSKNPPKILYRQSDCTKYNYEKIPLFALRCEMDKLIEIGNNYLPELKKIGITDYETESIQ